MQTASLISTDEILKGFTMTTQEHIQDFTMTIQEHIQDFTMTIQEDIQDRTCSCDNTRHFENIYRSPKKEYRYLNHPQPPANGISKQKQFRSASTIAIQQT